MKRFLLLLLLSCLLCLLYCTAVFSIEIPTFSPDGGSYSSSVTVTMACATAGATILYTTDGSDPMPFGGTTLTYYSPITLSTTTVLKAKGWIMGQGISSVKSATYTISAGVATPTFSPDSGTYYGTQSVTMSCSTSGATIRYTTDGSDPDSGDTEYVSAVSVTATGTLKARAFKTGLSDSAVKTGSYTILTQCATPTFNPDGGSYNNYQTVTMSCTTPSVTIRYTTDGNDPTDTSTVYSSPVAVNSTLTLKAKAFRTDLTASAVKSATYTLTVANLTFSPDAGTYNNNQSVTISCATTGATIRYTTDGSDPTTSSTTYSGAVSITQSWTLKAKAWKTGMTDSAIKSAAYVLLVSTPTFSPDGGTFSTTQSVTMSCATTGATIRYTTDGSDPTSGSTQYTGAVSVSQPLTLKAKAFKTGYTTSSTKSSGFSFYAATPTFSPDGGMYGAIQNVTISSATSGATIYYTIDGSTPTTSSYVYGSPVAITQDRTLKAIATKTDWANSSVKSAVYDLRLSGTCATPVFIPTKNPPYVPLGVAMTCSTTGAVMRYTVNGTEPTESSTPYDPEGYVVVGSPMTVKAKAFADDYMPSATNSTMYTWQGGGGTSYLYQTTVQVDPPIINLALTQIYEPNTMVLKWEPIQGNYPQYEVKRTYNGTDTSLGTTTAKTITDAFAFVSGGAYTYSVRGSQGSSDPDSGLPAPPPNPPAGTVYARRTWNASGWTPISVVPVRVQASANSTVDSRYDLRRADNHLVDFQFKNLIYRGGLYAGYASDSSRVGRSFIKYPLGSGSSIWAASVNTYHTRSATNGNTVVGAHVIADDSWNPDTIVWSNAPSLTPAAPAFEKTLSYDSSTFQPAWVNWPMAGIVVKEMCGDGVLSMGLASKTEANNGWAYFARKEFYEPLAPNVLYASSAPSLVLQMTLDSYTVKGGLTVRGRVYINHAAPSGGTQLSLVTSNPTIAMFSPITIPAGQTNAAFVLSTAIVSSTTTVNLYDSTIRQEASTTLTITP